MLNLILAVLLPFLITTTGEQTASNIEVIEIFRAETTEELEASLTDGYPMPWLEEILNDESIPEEDRYWLDCRVRAVIAQDLHLFFNEEGNPVHIDADWIKYGEYYWQEYFIVNPPGEYEKGTLNPETALYGEQGFVYNRFGERTGDLVLCETWLELSRDGSVGVLGHFSSDYVIGREYNPVYMYIVYSDGSYHMNPETFWGGAQNVLSQSGEYIMLVIENDPERIQLFNREGELLWEQSAMARGGTGIEPVILPNDEYCVFPCADRGPIVRYLQMFNVNDGSTVRVLYPENTLRTSFSPDGNLIFAGDKCVFLESNDPVWSIPSIFFSDYMLTGNACTNNGEYFTISYLEYHKPDMHSFVFDNLGVKILDYSMNSDQRLLISPNGEVILSSTFNHPRIDPSIPFSIWQIEGDQ